MCNMTETWKKEPFSNCIMPVRVDRTRQVKSRDYLLTGKHPVVDQGQGLIAGWTDNDAAVISDDLPYVVFGDHTRIFKYVDFPFALGADGTKVLRTRGDINPRYFYFHLLCLDIPSRGYSRHFRLLKEKEIALPPLPEQKKIATVLLKIQRAIETQEKIIQSLRDLKKSTMQHLFTHGLRGEKTKVTEIGEMPESWDMMPLAAFAEKVTKGSSPRWQGFTYKTEGVLFVRSQNVGWGRLLMDNIAYVDPSFNVKETRSILKKNDLLFNLVGASIGRVAMVDESLEGANTNQAVGLARLAGKDMHPRFAMYFFLTDMGQAQIAYNKKEIARANISLTDIKNFCLPKPATDEQIEIVDVVDTLSNAEASHESKKSALQDLFKTTLNKLMTGEIRTVDLDIDVSEVEA